MAVLVRRYPDIGRSEKGGIPIYGGLSKAVSRYKVV